MHRSLIVAIAAAACLVSTRPHLALAQASQNSAPATPTWEPDSLGNHRAVVHVDAGNDAVWVRVPWRRRDAKPEQVAVIVYDAKTQTRVANVARMEISREYGDIVFQPRTAPGDYFIYYLPYTGTFRSNYPKITYRPPEDRADRTWMARNGLTVENARLKRWQSLPQASVKRLESFDPFAAFTPMEYTASKSELDSLRARATWAEYFLFPEDRAFSIRMLDDIPARWAQTGAFQPLRGSARPGEYWTFQIGLWAHRMALDSVRYSATTFTRKGGGGELAPSALSAFNFGGVDWSGHRFERALHVDRGRVQPLWFGLDIPKSAAPGEYESDVTIHAANARERSVKIVVRVEGDTVTNHGDDDPKRLTRLRWLDSQLAADEEIVAPYTPMQVTASTVSVLGRALTFGADAMPQRIQSYFTPEVTSIGPSARDVLAAPMRFTIVDSLGKELALAGDAARITHRAAGAVRWNTVRRSGAVAMHVDAQMEFDGTTEFTVALRASQRTTLKRVRLEIPLRPDAARYLMGLGQKGGYRPRELHWKWDVAAKNQDAVWIGDVNAGLQLTIKDEHYVRPLNTNFYLSKPLVLPKSWGNGGCDVVEASARVMLSCESGQVTLVPGDSLRFDFRLMLTPFKPLDTAGQWKTRYFHSFVPVDSAARRGANTINVHHATRINPWINYPFLEPAQMKAYIDSAHAKGMKVKIYYTVRELTNHAPELFALRSLGDEVLSGGPGGGSSWLQEHVGADYLSAWHVPEIRDAALVNSGVSRWHNFYVEGLDWLVKHVGIDGLYIDDVAFDRLTMKRVRKVLDRGNRAGGGLIDLHSANQYNPRDGFASSANLYLEHFPFLNRLWFGEYFDYDSRPDYWLVEISGIPFGLMGEMLEKGGNPWRGMTFGMTNRMPWSGDPAPLWKAWDEFGIQRSKMIGWWSGHAPVATGDSAIVATTWVGAGKSMVSLGSWRDGDTPVTLTIDWKALGLDPARTRIRAPAIASFQEAATYKAGAPIQVPGKKGLILFLEQR